MRSSLARLVFDNQDESKKGAIIRKPGSRNLYILLYYHGRRIEKSTGLEDTPRNRAKVREWLDRQQKRIEAGTFVFAEAFPAANEEEKNWFATKEGWDYRPEPQNVLFGDYLEKWLKTIWANYPSESKKQDFVAAINPWIRPYFLDKNFYQITGVEFGRFLQTLRTYDKEKGTRPLSGSRVRNIFCVLRTIWNDACEEYRWNLPDPFRYIARHMPRRRKRHPEVFRYEEWQRVVGQIEPYYRPVCEFMLLTGMIASEVAGLRWEDVMEDRILVRNSIVKGREKDTLKNEYRIRGIPLTKRLREFLEEARRHAKGRHVFTMKSGLPFSANLFRGVWLKALKGASIPYRVPYTIRHTFAAWSLTIGVEPNRLVSLMGHGSKQMVYEVYGSYTQGLAEGKKAILDFFGNDYLIP